MESSNQKKEMVEFKKAVRGGGRTEFLERYFAKPSA